ncbi:MAG: FKBP-type peptidyl-prolyl cis-trans isomerase [Bacteroidota bacterium]
MSNYLVFSKLILMLIWAGSLSAQTGKIPQPVFPDGEAEFIELRDGIQVHIVNGDSELSQKSYKRATVHYAGWLKDGTLFDSSYSRYDEFRFRPFKNQVIAGWDIVVSHMEPGDKVYALLPAKYAYGDKGIPGRIPPDSELLFFIHLIEAK